MGDIGFGLQGESATGGGGEVNDAANVGIGFGWFKNKIGLILNFKSILAGKNISIDSLVDELRINAINTMILGFASDSSLGGGTEFAAFFTNGTDGTEIEAQGFLGFAFTVKRMTIHVGTNSSDDIIDISMRDDGVNVPNTIFAIPASTTGDFDSGIITESILASSLIGLRLNRNGSSVFDDYSIYVEIEK